ncbi:MAG: helix-turn-helix domain-containing protein [Rickettsiales bacterium]
MKTKHISEKDLAARWSLSFRTIQRWRLDGGSLPHFIIGKSVRYPLEAVEAFEAGNISTPTANNIRGL